MPVRLIRSVAFTYGSPYVFSSAQIRTNWPGVLHPPTRTMDSMRTCSFDVPVGQQPFPGCNDLHRDELQHCHKYLAEVPPMFPRTASTISTKRPCRGLGIVSMGLLANILADAVLYGLMMIAFHSEIRTMIVRIDRSTLLHTGFDKAIQRFTVG